MSAERVESFFYEHLTRVLTLRNLDLSSDAQAHLGLALCERVHHFSVEQLMRPLAPQYVAAVGADDRVALRRIGDQALLLRGFWWQYTERLHSHGVRADYYEDLGRRAYLLVRQRVFDELADRFQDVAQALALLWGLTHVHAPADIAELYRFWLHTHSRYAVEILKLHGINPESTRS